MSLQSKIHPNLGISELNSKLIILGYRTCIMSEFDYTTNPMETFPLDQRKERRSMFHVKRDIIPFLYWNVMLK